MVLLVVLPAGERAAAAEAAPPVVCPPREAGLVAELCPVGVLTRADAARQHRRVCCCADGGRYLGKRWEKSCGRRGGVWGIR